MRYIAPLLYSPVVLFFALNFFTAASAQAAENVILDCHDYSGISTTHVELGIPDRLKDAKPEALARDFGLIPSIREVQMTDRKLGIIQGSLRAEGIKWLPGKNIDEKGVSTKIPGSHSLEVNLSKSMTEAMSTRIEGSLVIYDLSTTEYNFEVPPSDRSKLVPTNVEIKDGQVVFARILAMNVDGEGAKTPRADQKVLCSIEKRPAKSPTAF